jgi:hypothetical protein
VLGDRHVWERACESQRPEEPGAAVGDGPPVASRLLVTRALDKDDQKLLALMTKRVGVTLRLQRVNGIVRSASGPGQYMIWEIARSP